MKHIYTLILILTCCIYFSSAQYSWKQKVNFGGTARAGSFGFSIDSLGYIGGGDNGIKYSDFWQYHPSTNSWTQKSSLPSVLTAASSFVINGKGYVTGGANNSSLNTNLYMYDPVANSWTGKASFPGNPIYGAAAFAIGTKGYFGVGNGGSGGGPYYTNLYEYDAIADNWTQKATFPGASRYGTYGISLNGKGYVGFGGDANSGTSFNDWWQYDPVTDTWSAKANFPSSGRDYPTGFVINNLIYVGTGDYYATSPFKDFYEYNDTNDTWTKRQDYGGASHTVGIGFSIGTIGYFGTGFDYSNHLNEFWEYSPDAIPPIASFTSSDSILCANECINFTNQSTHATSYQWFFTGGTPSSSTVQNPHVCYLTSGTYDVKLIASDGIGKDSVTFSNYIQVKSAPPTPVITQKGSTLYFNTDSSYSSYQWFDSAMLIPGATDTLLVVSHSGNCNVQISNKDGCKAAVGIYVVLTGTTSFLMSNTLIISPNPITSSFIVQFNTQLKNAVLVIYDLLGKEMMRNEINGDRIEIDKGNLKSGVYFVIVKDNKQQYIQKIVAE